MCDGKINCNDKSDEIACQKIRFDQAYLASLPPPPSIEGKITSEHEHG